MEVSVFVGSVRKCTLIAVIGSFTACFKAGIEAIGCLRFAVVERFAAVGRRRSFELVAVEKVGIMRCFIAAGVSPFLFTLFGSFTKLLICQIISM